MKINLSACLPVSMLSTFSSAMRSVSPVQNKKGWLLMSSHPLYQRCICMRHTPAHHLSACLSVLS